jgi:hypothetical protein
MKPACVPCQRFFRIVRTGVYFIEAMPDGHDRPEPGTAEPGKWKPYKLWAGDLWRCEGCDTEIVSGVAQQPAGEHYQQDFAERVQRSGVTIQINDC